MVHYKKAKLSDPQMKNPIAQDITKKKCQEIYYVSHYGTPIKDVRLKPTAIQKVTSVTNLTCTSLRAPAPLSTLKCKKSLSLQDLSPSFQKHLKRRRAHLCPNLEGVPPIMNENAGLPDERTKSLAFKALCRFLKNAFRKQKEELEIKDIYLKSTTSQVSNLKLQVSTLKALLKSDEQVISNSFKEINSLKGLLSSLQEEYNSAKKEKEDLQKVLDSTKDVLSEVRTESLNNKNACLMAQSEASAYESQLQKEREKITKLKNDNRALLDKVDEMTVNIKLKTEKMLNLDRTVNKMQHQANMHHSLLRTAQEKINQDERALEEASGCLRGLKKELGEAVMREGRLRVQVEEVSEKMADQSRRYDQILKERTLKMVELETRLELAAPRPLMARVFKFASGVISVPLVVLEALNSG